MEKTFSYDMLFNMAGNPLLPYSTIAAVMSLVNAIYVDRFPHVSHKGMLTEKLWLFHDNSAYSPDLVKRSTTPVVKDSLTLKSIDAFPAYFLPSLSSVFGHPDQFLSHRDHHKFFLLQKLYSNTIQSFGSAGRIIHDDAEFNQLGIAAIKGQHSLLIFGFQSTYEKLKELCKPNALLFDGRSDLKSRGLSFHPPEARYKDGGAEAEQVVVIKKELIKTFNEVGKLVTNFRLGQLLHLVKEKAIKWTIDECFYQHRDMKAQLGFNPEISVHAKNKIRQKKNQQTMEYPAFSKEAQYVMQSSKESIEEMYQDFEALFPGGSGAAAKLDLKELCDKPDFEASLIDAIMYDDDELMAASLNLLDNVYGQRREVRDALENVNLLTKLSLPVFGDVHVLKNQVKELVSILLDIINCSTFLS
jgi:hypothetical protein